MCKCQHSPIYLPEPRATSCNPLFTSVSTALPRAHCSPPHRPSPSFLSLEHPSILHPFHPLFSTSIPRVLHLNNQPPPHPTPSFPAMLHSFPSHTHTSLSSHFYFLHLSCFTNPLTLSSCPSSLSWIMALHWSHIMTFPVLSITTASHFLGLLHCTTAIALPTSTCIYFKTRACPFTFGPVRSQNTSSLSSSSPSVSFCHLSLFFHFFVFLLVSLYPSLYLSVIAVMTHVVRTCSAVEGPPWFHKLRLATLKVWLHVGSV